MLDSSRQVPALCSIVLAFGCSSSTPSSGADPSGTAGTGSNSMAIGGSLALGGSFASGGVTTGGTVRSSGGSTTSSTGLGGAGTTGGSSTTGGKASGGANPGGSSPTGGTPTFGGKSATGGVVATGGSAQSGGAATGGQTGQAGSSVAGSTSVTRVSVLEHHNHQSRDGVYVDAALTTTRVGSMHVDTTFANATLAGPTYAHPLYLASSGADPDLVIAATEQNHVYAFDAKNGAVVWDKTLAAPLPQSALASLRNGCGNIDPLGVTGTPVIDAATRTIYLDAMTSTSGTAASARHLVYALDANSGNTKPGWPVDLNAAAKFGSTTFDSLVQNQRGALTLVGGKVYVPFGGHVGDCSTYHGWIIGINTEDPTQVSAWATRALAGGVWAPSGVASDGTSIYFSTGNTENAANTFTPPATWQDGETVFRLPTSLVFSNQAADYWVPTNWQELDTADADLGGTGPILFDLPGANPSTLVVALGKDGRIYLLNRNNLGGISAPVSSATVSTGYIINSAAVYRTANTTYVLFRGPGSSCPSGQSGAFTAVKLTAASPPTAAIAWCAGPATLVSASVSVTDAQGSNALVWTVGSDNKLRALDATTGQTVFSGGSSTDVMSSVQRYQAPVVANGRVFVAANNRVYAFAPQ